MPLYEYRCRKCRKRVTVLTLRVGEKAKPACDRCGSRDLDRLMSRFATIKSEEDRLESLADPSKLGDLDENDPKSVGRWMRKMGREMGEEFSGDEFDSMVEEMEAGGEGESNGETRSDGESPGDEVD